MQDQFKNHLNIQTSFSSAWRPDGVTHQVSSGACGRCQSAASAPGSQSRQACHGTCSGEDSVEHPSGKKKDVRKLAGQIATAVSCQAIVTIGNTDLSCRVPGYMVMSVRHYHQPLLLVVSIKNFREGSDTNFCLRDKRFLNKMSSKADFSLDWKLDNGQVPPQ